MPYHPPTSYGADPHDPQWNSSREGLTSNQNNPAYAPNYQYEVPPSLQPSSPRPPQPQQQQQQQPHGFHPAAHPDSAYSRIRQERQYGDEYPADMPNYSARQQRSHPTIQPVGRSQTNRTESTVSPGADNLGPLAAGGGISGIATGIANSHERESGVEAVRGMHSGNLGPHSQHNPYAEAPYYVSSPDYNGGHMDGLSSPRTPASYGSNVPLGAAMEGNGHYAHSPGRLTPSDPGSFHHHHHQHSGQSQAHYDGLTGTYSDPYHRQRTSWQPMNEPINPNDILDDGDDGFMTEPKRRSVLSSLGKNSSHQSLSGAAAGGAAGAGVAGALASRGPDGGPSYNAVPGERSEWLVEQKASKKKMRWIIAIVLILLVVGGVAGGVVGGLLASKKGSSSSPSKGSGGGGQSADEDSKMNGDLGKDSKEIKALMNNPNLRKVFPGMDYTPWGTQYPLCMTYPPSQNNVTRDLAVLSQMTNVVRLYGTDCNQTEMVLHAIDRLGLKDMKVWLGVWIDHLNTTTNDRQLEQMYKILRTTKDKSIFKGVVVGNEVLFRGRDTPTATMKLLSDYIKDVKSNFTDLSIDLPVSTSDLGDAWTADLAQLADVVMSNVHPFFAGVTPDEATDWTYEFWTNRDVSLTKGTKKKHLISEVGWPTEGGNTCGPGVECDDSKSGSVAGIKELNEFMENWVCTALEKGTQYFWLVVFFFSVFVTSLCCDTRLLTVLFSIRFEAFDEPWKVQFNEPGKEWEDKWGLMDPGRKLKPGVKIPDCGGKRAD